MPAEESHPRIKKASPLPGGGFFMRAVIFANGVLNDPQAANKLIQHADLLIAADGGAKHCQALGITPKILIGDLDSQTEEEVEAWEKAGVEVIRHNPRKDETDLELALLYAKETGADEALVLGGLGSRWDMTIANLLLPAYQNLKGMQVVFWDAGQWLYLVSDRTEISGQPGQTVSLIPIGGDAREVTAQGLEWPLEDETLVFGATRGVSNVLVGETATVSLKEGLLLCVITGDVG